MRASYRRHARLGAGALLTAAVAACSADAADDRASPRDREGSASVVAEVADTPGCELLTPAEIETATGVASARAEWDQETVRGCSWFQSDGRPLLGIVIGAAPSTYEEYIQNLREQAEEFGPMLEGVDTSTVSDLGDYAIWHEMGRGSYLNAARDGDLFVLMIFEEPPGDKSMRDAAVELTRSGLERL